MDSPWLSVVIPTYNGAAYLIQTLESIRLQRESGIEIIAIDDGSTDATLEILKSYAEWLPLRVIERGRVGSWVANSDYALREATGSYACILHQDDFWRPRRLEILREQTRRHPDVVMWLHTCLFADSNGRSVGRWTCPLSPHEGGMPADSVLERLLVQNFIGMPAPLFQREAAISAGGMDARLWFVADWDLWLKLAGRGNTAYLPQALAAFRIHPESQTIKRGHDLIDLREQYEIVFRRHFPLWKARDEALRQRVRSAFEASLNVNLYLMGRVQGRKESFRGLLWQLFRLGPAGWHRLLRDSRLWERIVARVRCRWRP